MAGVWDKTKPLGSDPKKLGDDDMRNTKAYLEEALGREHSFPGSDVGGTSGLHAFKKGDQTARDALAAVVEGRIFARTDTRRLQVYHGGAWIDLNDPPDDLFTVLSHSAGQGSSPGVTPDMVGRSAFFSITLTEDLTINNPSNLPDAGFMLLALTQDAGSAYTVSFGAKYKFPEVYADIALGETRILLGFVDEAGDLLFFPPRELIPVLPIGTDDIEDDAVTGEKIPDGEIGANHLASGVVTDPRYAYIAAANDLATEATIVSMDDFVVNGTKSVALRVSFHWSMASGAGPSQFAVRLRRIDPGPTGVELVDLDHSIDEESGKEGVFSFEFVVPSPGAGTYDYDITVRRVGGSPGVLTVSNRLLVVREVIA